MKLKKVIEILQINIREGRKKMPPDVLTALQIALAACTLVKDLRDRDLLIDEYLLPGETPEKGK